MHLLAAAKNTKQGGRLGSGTESLQGAAGGEKLKQHLFKSENFDPKTFVERLGLLKQNQLAQRKLTRVRQLDTDDHRSSASSTSPSRCN